MIYIHIYIYICVVFEKLSTSNVCDIRPTVYMVYTVQLMVYIVYTYYTNMSKNLVHVESGGRERV